MRELALFAGAGGGLLGSKLLGWRTVCAVEKEPYRREVLLRRQRDGVLDLFPIWDDIQTFDGTPWRGCVDIITAGFPCQPWSVAGKQRGEDDERNLWPDTIRVIREVGSRFALLENVPSLLAHEYFGTILGELAEAGYNAEWCVLGADDVGAPHRRKRIWILAHTHPSTRGTECGIEQDMWSKVIGGSGEIGATDVAHAQNRDRSGRRCESRRLGEEGSQLADAPSNRSQAGISRSASGQKGESRIIEHAGEIIWWLVDPADVEYAECEGPQECNSEGMGRPEEHKESEPSDGEGFRGVGEGGGAPGPTQPVLGRVAHGVAHRVDRLAALGDGQVPAVVRAAWRLLSGEGEV